MPSQTLQGHACEAQRERGRRPDHDGKIVCDRPNAPFNQPLVCGTLVKAGPLGRKESERETGEREREREGERDRKEIEREREKIEIEDRERR